MEENIYGILTKENYLMLLANLLMDEGEKCNKLLKEIDAGEDGIRVKGNR